MTNVVLYDSDAKTLIDISTSKGMTVAELIEEIIDPIKDAAYWVDGYSELDLAKDDAWDEVTS